MMHNKEGGPRFAGYAAIFDHIDHGGDIIRRGAFAGALRTGIPLLRHHDSARRIGTVEHLQEDARGLRVIAGLNAGEAVAKGAGLSFGYRIRAKNDRTYRELLDLELIEISLVDSPMQPLARVIAVESGPDLECEAAP